MSQPQPVMLVPPAARHASEVSAPAHHVFQEPPYGDLNVIKNVQATTTQTKDSVKDALVTASPAVVLEKANAQAALLVGTSKKENVLPGVAMNILLKEMFASRKDYQSS